MAIPTVVLATAEGLARVVAVATTQAARAATAGTMGKMYRSCFPAESEKKPTMTTIQIHSSVRTRVLASAPLERRSRHEAIAAGTR